MRTTTAVHKDWTNEILIRVPLAVLVCEECQIHIQLVTYFRVSHGDRRVMRVYALDLTSEVEGSGRGCVTRRTRALTTTHAEYAPTLRLGSGKMTRGGAIAAVLSSDQI